MNRSLYRACCAALAVVIFVLIIGVSCATPPARPDDVLGTWTFGDNASLTGTSFTGTDSGLVICGYGDLSGKGIRGYAIKGDIYGHQYWARDYGLEGDNYLYKILRLPDGYCLLVGENRPAGSGSSLGLVLMISEDGNVTFIKSYGTGSFSDAVREPDGNYLIVGTNRSVDGTSGIWLVRIDGDGNVKMARTAGTNGSCAGKIVMACDGGYTVAGTILSEGTPYRRAYTLHVDGNGSRLWEQTYSDPGSGASTIVPYADGYMLAGHTGGSPRNLMLYRLNLSGAVVWHHIIEGGIDRDAAAIASQADGGWVLAGDETDGHGKPAGFIMKVDADGQIEWNRTFSDDRPTSLRDLIAFSDNYYCAGTNDGRFWLVNIGINRGSGPSPFCWCLPWLVLPALVISVIAIRRRRAC